MSDSIKVVCRLRPLNKIEIANNGVECVTHTNKELAINVIPKVARWADRTTNTTSPSTGFSALTLTRSTFTRRSEGQSSSQSSAALMVPFLPMAKPEGARPGPWRYFC